MSLINWIFDVYQHTRIENAHSEASAARAELASMRANGGGASDVDLERLEHALGALALATKTFQRMLVEKGVCTHEEFAALMHQIDLEDGRRDGQAPLP